MSRNLDCAVDCKYCIVSRTASKSIEWNYKNIGFNNSTIFIGRFINDKPLENLGIDFNLLANDIVGLGIVDCFDMRYFDDLKFMINNLDNFKIKKLALISKIPINNDILGIIKGSRVVVAYSLTGLDKYHIENTTTKERLKSLERLVSNDIDCLALIQPYIHGASDLSFLRDLKNIGVNYVACKGFTYNKSKMPELHKSGIDSDILSLYENSSEKEVFIGLEYVKAEINKFGLEYVDFKEYIARNTNGLYRLSREDAIKSVDRVFSYLNDKITICSSSDSLDEIRLNAIKRRMA